MTANAPTGGRARARVDYDPFSDGPLQRVVPTTEPQREVWLAAKLDREASLAYNESINLHLSGPIEIETLRRALDRVVARHDALRASFSADGMQLMVSEAAPLALPFHDLSERPDAAGELAQARVAAVETPFDLEAGPLLRASLYRLSAEEHVLLLKILGEASSPSTLTVRIGSEVPHEGFSTTSVVTTGYGPGDEALGTLGVLGPTRMDYPGAMASVRAVAQYLSKILDEA